ncbi:hypothetical protein chiPu_0017134 [Chiloscyllium punctatum]|uniref:Uncharacterized protein n=1 Tax=Chiloscyllium punctatum TaxID=137246 RepID=A0A401T7J9_CHIPU|nr:hypothetical protein [Chiloscyllium punctatum]
MAEAFRAPSLPRDRSAKATQRRDCPHYHGTACSARRLFFLIDCIPKKTWGEIMDELDELGELDCDGAESLQAVNQSLLSEEIRDLLLEYEKRYEAMEKEKKHLKTKAKFLKLTKLEVTEQLESR